MSENILKMEHISKDFFGVRALNDVSFNVKKGEIHALVGENGAGKSTLMNVLSGSFPHGNYSGNILYEGEECKFSKIKDSEAKGIVIIHQELALVPTMSVAENMFLGNECSIKGVINWDLTNQQARKYLDMVGFKGNEAAMIKDIGVGSQQLVEIAKALAKNVRLLILDEPTAALTEKDSKHLLDLLLDLKKNDVTCILISHKLDEVCYCADRVTILRDGKSVMTMNEDVQPFDDNVIVKAMVGREIIDRYPKRDNYYIKDEIGFEIKNWSTFHPIYEDHQIVKDASLFIRKGEIVGLYGLMGAGRTEMAMSVFGRSYGQKTSGRVLLCGKEVKLKSPREAIANGISYVSEDRKVWGLVLAESIRFNISLAGIRTLTMNKSAIIDTDKECVVAEEYSKQLKIKSTNIEQYAESLSGGNQQKVVLSRSLFTKPNVYILDEPTRGIDVGSKYEIYCIMNDLVKEGKSVLFISSDLPEILGMSDRIYVMNEGEICGEIPAKDASQESIMKFIVKSNSEV